MEEQPEQQEIETTADFTPSMRSLIFGSPEHSPTALQTQLLYNYITDEEGRTPPQLLRAMGNAPHMWWVWPKRHPGFLKWWNTIIEHTFAAYRLNDIYNALCRRGVKHDTAAAKIVIQRFDPRFTERSTQDSRHTFGGYSPPAAARSEERQRKALAEQGESLPVVEGDTRERPALPASGPEQGDCRHADTPRQDHAPDAITGGDAQYTSYTGAIAKQYTRTHAGRSGR